MHEHTAHFKLIALLPSLVIACGSPDTTEPPTLVQRSEPVLGGPGFPEGIASDPSLQRVGDGWVMAYTCLDAAGEDTRICMAISDDGTVWQPVPSLIEGGLPGTVLAARAPEKALEGPALLIDGNAVTIYASTYGAAADPATGFPARLLRFTGTLNPLSLSEGEEALSPVPNTGSCDAVYSPTVRRTADGYEMIFAGHCYDIPQPEGSVGGLTLLRATSTDGARFTVVGPVASFDPAAVALFGGGLAEPSFVEGRDDVLFVSAGFSDGQQQHTFLARRNADGLFVPDEQPIMGPREGHDGCGAFAPDAHVDGDTLRVWYLSFSCEGFFSIGLAEGPVAILD